MTTPQTPVDSHLMLVQNLAHVVAQGLPWQSAYDAIEASARALAAIPEGSDFEFEAPGLRSFGMKVPSPMEYGKKCYERGFEAGKKAAPTTPKEKP